MKITNSLPAITQKRSIAKSKFFDVEEINLTFSNNEKRVYERMVGLNSGAVMIVPMLDDNTLMLVREYCAGTHSYELGFPKGLIDPGEKAAEAAQRELKEEIGYGAKTLTFIQEVAMAPAFFSAKMSIFFAQGLYAKKLIGDEPEPLELVKWPLSDYRELLAQSDFNESRSIAALLLIKDHLGE